MKTVKARLVIELHAKCPRCDHIIDLMDEADTDGVAHNDENALILQAVPEGDWSESHEKFELDDVTCGMCRTVFNVKTIEW